MQPPPEELPLGNVRTELARDIAQASIRGRITYLTNRGRRVAAIVSVQGAEALERAADDAE